MTRSEITAWQRRAFATTKKKDLDTDARLDLQRDIALYEIALQLAIGNELKREHNRLLRRRAAKRRG